MALHAHDRIIGVNGKEGKAADLFQVLKENAKGDLELKVHGYPTVADLEGGTCTPPKPEKRGECVVCKEWTLVCELCHMPVCAEHEEGHSSIMYM